MLGYATGDTLVLLGRLFAAGISQKTCHAITSSDAFEDER